MLRLCSYLNKCLKFSNLLLQEFTDVIKDTLSLNQKTDNGEIIEVTLFMT